MNKKLQALASKQALSDFTNKLSAKWRLGIQPNTPSKVEEGESTESILRDLIAMPTTTGNYEANHEALDYIDRFLSGRGMFVRRHTWNGVESLVATTRRTKTPAVFLSGHVDVVPAPPALFELREANGKYYGRGALDMKGAVAAYLGVVRDLQDHLQDYDFGIMIVTDEEAGGFDGAERLAAEGYLPDVMVLPDGGTNWGVERFAKGIWHITVEASGKSAHGSRPWEGMNAIDTLMSALQEIKALFPEPTNESSTINIGVIQGGEAINQIPASALASLDMRFGSLAEQKSIHAQILAIAQTHRLKVTTEVESDPMVSDPANPYLRAYAACTEAIVGKPVEWVISNASNDGRHFARYGVQCAISYPEGGNHHGLDEHITKDSLEKMERLFQMFLRKAAHRTSPLSRVNRKEQ